jgi:hypothetical protein
LYFKYLLILLVTIFFSFSPSLFGSVLLLSFKQNYVRVLIILLSHSRICLFYLNLFIVSLGECSTSFSFRPPITSRSPMFESQPYAIFKAFYPFAYFYKIHPFNLDLYFNLFKFLIFATILLCIMNLKLLL